MILRHTSSPARAHTRSRVHAPALLSLAIAAGTTAAQPGVTPDQPMAPTIEQRPGAVVDTSSLGLLWIQRLDGMALDVAPPRLLPEGTPVIDRTGRLVRAGGHWIFVDDSGEDGAIGPVLVMPSRLLQSVLAGGPDNAKNDRWRVSGRLTLYRGVNAMHLASAAPILPTPDNATTGDAPDTETEPVADTEPAGSDPSNTDPLIADDPDVRDLIDRLDELPSLSPPSDDAGWADIDALRPTGDAPSSATRAEPQRRGGARNDGYRDGDLMSRRTGRLTRTPEGRWAFAIDRGVGDARDDTPRQEGPAAVGQEFTIQPGAALERLESIALRQGDGVRVELSGLVMMFNERTFVLPTVYRVLPPSDLDPMG